MGFAFRWMVMVVTFELLFTIRTLLCQSPNCTITVTTLEETNSGEHKAKIGGIIIGEGNGTIDIGDVPQQLQAAARGDIGTHERGEGA